MISFDNSPSAGILAQPTSAPSNPSAGASSDDDSSASFSDVMQQHQEPSVAPQPKAEAPASAKPKATAEASTADSATAETASDASAPPPAPATTPVPAKTPATPLAAGSDLAAMIIQATVLASNAQATPTVPATNSPLTPAAPTPGKTSLPATQDLATLIAQATVILSGGKATVAAAGGTTTVGTTTLSTDKSAPGSSTTSTKTQATTTSSPIDLSTLIAQSSILAQAVTVISGTTSGKNMPISGSTTAGIGNTAKEKKSAASSTGGSFLQSGTAASSLSTSSFSLMAELQAATNGAAGNQQFAPISGTKNSVVESATSGASSLAGTANVEKGKAMSSDFNFSELELLSGNGTNAVPTPSSADMHIQLASNNDFSDALNQVMHVAALAESNGSRAPMRVEMEIQTPPGAVVNVYVSKQADGWRAQLSTNDPVALAWVQQQVTSLKQSTDLGVEVKWLPPQLEGTGTIATSGGQESNLSWNQGGQGQSQYQQPDDRQQSGQQPEADTTPEFADIQSGQFMQTLSALGRAA